MRSNHYALIGVLAVLLLAVSCQSFAQLTLDDWNGYTTTAPGSHASCVLNGSCSDWASSPAATCAAIIARAGGGRNDCGPAPHFSGNHYQCKASFGACPGGDFASAYPIAENRCAPGEQFDGTSCELIAPPPVLDSNCDEFEEAWQNDEIAFIPSWTGGSDPTSFCTPRYSEDDDACEDVIGYFNDIQLCNDDKNDCEAIGGTYGAFGIDGDIETAICLPDDYADQLPTCDISSVQILTVNSTDDVGGFGCSSSLGDIEDPVEGDTTSNTPEESDIDGDGIPDRNDADMDGDGIVNGSDPDADGDGIPDVDDPEVGGDDQENSVSGGGSCDVRPSCTGDAVQCAILFQTYSTRCAIEAQGDGDLELTGFDPAATDLTVPGAGVLQDDGDTDLSNQFDSLLSTSGPSGSCPADFGFAFSTVGPISFSYGSMCDFAGQIKPLVLLLFGFLAFRIGMRAFE